MDNCIRGGMEGEVLGGWVQSKMKWPIGIGLHDSDLLSSYHGEFCIATQQPHPCLPLVLWKCSSRCFIWFMHWRFNIKPTNRL